MKKVLILGIGAQSSAIADLLNRKKDVAEIICADRNLPAAEELCSRLSKANAVDIDIMNYDEMLANAKLIEAAPKLLESCINLIKHIKDSVELYDDVKLTCGMVEDLLKIRKEVEKVTK